jgi:hypothetical protein
VFLSLSCIAIGIKDAGWTSGTGTHCTESLQETDVFKEKLSGWLKDNGFVPTQDPGGMTSSSGFHAAGEINEWYKGTYKDSPPILLRVATLYRGAALKGRAEFNFSHSWSVRGPNSYIERMQSLSKEFGAEFSAWCKSTKVPSII